MVLGVSWWTKRTVGAMRPGGGGVERLLTRFDRFEIDLGMSAGKMGEPGRGVFGGSERRISRRTSEKERSSKV